MANNAHHVSGAGTFVLETAPCTLNTININTAGTTVTAYDNSAGSGNVVAVFGAVTGSFQENFPLTVGLTLVVVGTADVTVVTS